MGVKPKVHAYEPTGISNRKRNPVWKVREGAVYFVNEVEASKRKGGLCVMEGIES